jgi:hypothetical protein
MRWWMTAALILGVACGAPAHRREPVAVAPWLRMDSQRCLIPRDLREGMEQMARRCAETFVRENGYTDALVDDSSRWVREADDWAEWPRVLAGRVGTLEAKASSVQCSMRECLVLFRLRRPALLCAFRAVTMTQVFTKIRLTPGGIRDTRCNERRV